MFFISCICFSQKTTISEAHYYNKEKDITIALGSNGNVSIYRPYPDEHEIFGMHRYYFWGKYWITDGVCTIVDNYGTVTLKFEVRENSLYSKSSFNYLNNQIFRLKGKPLEKLNHKEIQSYTDDESSNECKFITEHIKIENNRSKKALNGIYAMGDIQYAKNGYL